MNYATIKYNDIANGQGVRTSLFVSGCKHHCPNCFNEVAWAFDYGEEFTLDVQNAIINSLKDDYNDGLSLLGGEPFEAENQPTLTAFLERVKKEVPSKTVWCYTGFIFDKELLGNSRAVTPYTLKMLSMIDVLVDGRYIEKEKDISLEFRGSANQRIIDVKKSLESGEVVLYNLSEY